MQAIGAAVVGATAISLDFKQDVGASDAKVTAVVRHHGHLLATRVKANASGRPGPNAPTGDYRRSITLRVESVAGFITAYVGTNLPQGRRLEFGFHGMDSLGRVYNQPPYPHFGPALDSVAPEFTKGIEKYLESL